MGFHDFFMEPPVYMTASVVILIIFELVLVFFLLKRNPYLYINFRINIVNALRKLTLFCFRNETSCIRIKILNFLQKTPKPLPNKKVNISIVNEETRDQFIYEQISEKFANKMKQMDSQHESESKSHSHNNREFRQNSITSIKDESVNESLLSSV